MDSEPLASLTQISPATLSTLRANQRFLVAELLRRGAEVRWIDQANDLIEARLLGRRELFLDIDSSVMPYAASTIASSKSITKALLSAAGIATPQGMPILVTEYSRAISYADKLGYPVVVKPSVGSQGIDVYLDVMQQDDLVHALQQIEEHRGVVEVLIERQSKGHEYRVFMTKAGEYAVILREPAFVIGDGRSTIRTLAERESERRMNPRTNCLGVIVLDDVAGSYLRKQGSTFESVPERRERVYLRRTSNLSLGGFAHDVTDIVHRSVVDICRRAIETIPGLPYAGIDFMCQNIGVEQSLGSYCILEMNSLPGIGMHHAPGSGRSRNVAGMIVDLVFPESAVVNAVMRSDPPVLLQESHDETIAA